MNAWELKRAVELADKIKGMGEGEPEKRAMLAKSLVPHCTPPR